MTVTNGMEDIYAALEYGVPLTLLEYHPAQQGADVEEHLDEAWVEHGRPQWRRVWPTSEGNPNHDQLDQWTMGVGRFALEASRLLIRDEPIPDGWRNLDRMHRAPVSELLGADPDWLGGQSVDEYMRGVRRR
ncbi:hypothetical protein OG589_12215 [Sphaerisporangium sp. NBC_01403]|uniref:hypothetical protein n=1 Tax=Sphaerisporangium sp. NBC_01403 TaxID=2903599 RepID=UPI00324E0A21